MTDKEELQDSQHESGAAQKILVADDEASIRRISFKNGWLRCCSSGRW